MCTASRSPSGQPGPGPRAEDRTRSGSTRIEDADHAGGHEGPEPECDDGDLAGGEEAEDDREGSEDGESGDGG
jgi:hypothetical protein